MSGSQAEQARPSVRLDIEPRLGEEAVLQAIELAPGSLRRRFRRQRDEIYGISDLDAKEAEFADLHRRWLERLRVTDSLCSLLAEVESISLRTSRCLLLWATSEREEHADLRDASGAAEKRPVLIIRLRAQTLLHAGEHSTRLRRELLHVADLLDPDFGFDPSLALEDESPALTNLMLDRYRVLWDTTIDGRLRACGVLSEEDEERDRWRFKRMFPMLGTQAGAAFERFFSGPRPRHDELTEFAAHPSGTSASDRRDGARCSLCRLPTAVLHLAPDRLESSVVEAIREDFPSWTSTAGLCPQCADLYSARVSLSTGRASRFTATL